MNTAEMETLIKSVKETADAIKKAHEDESATVEKRVEETLKKLLKNHPGVTPQRTLSFDKGAIGEGGEEELVKACPIEVQKEMDKIYILSTLLRKHPKELKSWSGFRKMFTEKADDFRKALDSSTAGGVDEWVPTEMSPQLVEKIRLQLKVAALFPVVPMASNPFELPVEIGDFNSFGVDENTADGSGTEIPVGDTSNISSKCTFTAKGHKTRVLTSKEATEDSIVALMPLVERKIAFALAQGREDFVLNGDTAGTHEDSDTTSSTSRRKKWLGLRAMANDNTYTRDLSTLAPETLLELRGDMGVYGVNPGDVAWITSIKGLIQLMKIDAVMTLDKIGPQAIIIQGMLGNVLGSPLIISEYVRTDLNASAVYQSGETKTVIYCVNRNAFAFGEKRRPTTEFFRELYATYDQNAMIATERVDFQPLFPIATNRAINLGINVG